MCVYVFEPIYLLKTLKLPTLPALPTLIEFIVHVRTFRVERAEEIAEEHLKEGTQHHKAPG
jgi:hypothetical protein